MGTILIRCPTTKSYVFTGLMMDHAAFFESDLKGRRLLCPDCGEIHSWTRKDAWIKDWPQPE